MEGTAKKDVDRRLATMTTIIVSIAAERFGMKEAKAAPSAYAPNHQARRIQGRTQGSQKAVQDGR